MLPMHLMQTFVDYQDNPSSFPPLNEIIEDADEHVMKLEKRFDAMEAKVMGQLESRISAVFAALASLEKEMAAEDPNFAAQPQLDNIQQALVIIRKLYQQNIQALEDARKKLELKKVQNKELQNEIKQLRAQLKATDSPVLAFVKETGNRAATYAANLQHQCDKQYEHSRHS